MILETASFKSATERHEVPRPPHTGSISSQCAVWLPVTHHYSQATSGVRKQKVNNSSVRVSLLMTPEWELAVPERGDGWIIPSWWDEALSCENGSAYRTGQRLQTQSGTELEPLEMNSLYWNFSQHSSWVRTGALCIVGQYDTIMEMGPVHSNDPNLTLCVMHFGKISTYMHGPVQIQIRCCSAPLKNSITLFLSIHLTHFLFAKSVHVEVPGITNSC